MKYGGQGPADYGPPGQQGFPGQQSFGMGPSPGGSIRNTLGAGLKSNGVFQKDGQITNSRGGFFGPKGYPQQGYPGGPEYGGYPQGGGFGYGNQGMPPGPGMGGGKTGKGGPFSFLGSNKGGGPGFDQPRQLILEPAQQGMTGNGIATISPDNSFTLVANLPHPSTFLSGQSTYASYLVDNKGKNGFMAGVLRPVGNGIYQTQFRSNVPLSHYSRVVISAENPQQIGQYPNGPIVLKVKEPTGPAAFLRPAKNAGGSVWKKITGLFQKKPAASPVPEGGGISPELMQNLDKVGAGAAAGIPGTEAAGTAGAVGNIGAAGSVGASGGAVPGAAGGQMPVGTPPTAGTPGPAAPPLQK